MELKEGTEWKRAWFVLDALTPDLIGYAKRPSGGLEPPLHVIPLEDVSQVLKNGESAPVLQKKKREELAFSLCDASGQTTIATFRCEDKSTLLWWLHGFQRRIFEQTKGMLRQMKRQDKKKEQQDSKGKKHATISSTTRLPRAQTVAKIVVPVKETKTVAMPNNHWFLVTQAAAQGRRKNMEDETLIKLELNKELNLPVEEHGMLSIVAIFDGHAGRECAEFSSEFIVQNVVEQAKFKEHDLAGALEAAFVKTDTEFRKWAMDSENISGTTALVCLFRNREVFVANAGDCRAVLSRGKKAVDLSVDHKPQREDEKKRIEAAGGWVESQEVLNIPKLYALGLEHAELLDEQQELVGWVTVHKVCGALAMTRSFGDVLIKDMLSDNFECTLETGYAAPLILCHPEIQHCTIDAATDEFLLLACDGLYDVFSSQEAVDFIHGELSRGTAKPEVAGKLIARAIELGSLDNVSVVVLYFQF
jgi:protein phosphatase 2C family protein 2/3